MADAIALAGRRLLLAAHEAGAGSVLAALAAQWAPAAGSHAYLSAVAAPYFDTLGIPSTVITEVPSPAECAAWIAATRPEVIVVGASAGLTLEKRLIDAAHEARIPVVAVVDHHWNLWQRFADERTAARWRYLPDEIHVPAARCAERIVAQGAPADRVRVFRHPLMTVPARPPAAVADVRRARAEFGLPEGTRVLLYASEFNFPADPQWQWEQSLDADITTLLVTLLEAAVAAPMPVVVLVKLHPAQPDDPSALLAQYPADRFRLVRAADKGTLFAASDAVFGLRSMLLVEGALAGVPAYAFQSARPDDAARMPEIRDDITELTTVAAVRATVSALLSAR